MLQTGCRFNQENETKTLKGKLSVFQAKKLAAAIIQHREKHTPAKAHAESDLNLLHNLQLDFCIMNIVRMNHSALCDVENSTLEIQMFHVLKVFLQF